MCSTQTIRLHVTEVGDGQVFLVASVQHNTAAPLAAVETYAQLGEILSDRGMTIVQERIFGSVSVAQDFRNGIFQPILRLPISRGFPFGVQDLPALLSVP